MTYESNARTVMDSRSQSRDSNNATSLHVPTVKVKYVKPTIANTLDKKNTAMNLGSSDPRSALSFLSQDMLGSEHNLARTGTAGTAGLASAAGKTPAETVKTSQSGYRKIKNTMKNLLKQSSIALGGNMRNVVAGNPPGSVHCQHD